ncbi:MAG: hypothetical protein IPH75_15420 [bacterium]|nr:hypothetical protein [bacterium]
MTDSFFRDQTDQSAEVPPEDTSLPKQVPPEKTENEQMLTDDSRLAAIISYIPFLCFIPLVNINWRENDEARFHARQGIILFIIELVAVVLLIDDLAKFVFKAVLIGAGALAAAGIYFAMQGKRIRLPLISDIADKAKL